ncbi:aminotransferase class V-fold PLP-dependent enzyme [Burkholderiaceae bacterium DAT-1]|nr:aminotransferase class V-fold PLP-dependent enzyme [Burkholderiaceae bacterium DAT-1]
MSVAPREIYLDANATTPVLPAVANAAYQAMLAEFGNPSSVHSRGLPAKAMMDKVRQQASRWLGASKGRILFTSGATEGIQTAVLSALTNLRARRADGQVIPSLLLYGATEHKAVPEALNHWNQLLGLNLDVRSIPVNQNGLHDLDFIRTHARDAGLVCTMAGNNETGVISDLKGIEAALSGSSALWMVDGVQALGKLPLKLDQTRIDYAPFSGHKLYAPKGIGMLYVRAGAPFTPLIVGGGQESGARSGTENMSGIAALGAVFEALESGLVFKEHDVLQSYRQQLLDALYQSFPGLVLNAPLAGSLPTTVNFSVPGLSSKDIMDVFDAAGIRVSAGSACGASKALPSYVLQAMGVPDWQAASAVRMSFGPATDQVFIDEACLLIKRCGNAMRESGMIADAAHSSDIDGISQFRADGVCSWLIADRQSACCVVIDPVASLVPKLTQVIQAAHLSVLAVLDTHGHADHHSAATHFSSLLAPGFLHESRDILGWPSTGIQVTHKQGMTLPAIKLGRKYLARLATPGHTADSVTYLLGESADAFIAQAAFCGDMILTGGMGRTDFASSSTADLYASLQMLGRVAEPNTILCPTHDYDNLLVTTLATEGEIQPLIQAVLAGLSSEAHFSERKMRLDQGLPEPTGTTILCGTREAVPSIAGISIPAAEVARFVEVNPDTLLLDVREQAEHLAGTPLAPHGCSMLSVPLGRIVNALAGGLLNPNRPILVFCRSGNRSAQVVQCLRRLGWRNVWQLSGGAAFWPASLS